MHWTSQAGAGFTKPNVDPWLPFGDLRACNVTDQRGDRDSVLNLVRDLLALRRRTPDLQRRDQVTLASVDGAWVWRRGEGIVDGSTVHQRERAAAVNGNGYCFMSI